MINLWVFPEGTRKNTGEIHEFKKGAFRAAISAQLPLLPIVFTQFYFLQSKEKHLDQGEIIMTVLPPISTEGLTAADVPKLMAETHSAMTTTFISTSKELKDKVHFPLKKD
uniref:1-acylglycerol-3-phosphate O-acyltransferase n=1 Tax=Clastoptera arizonana TaxID=38151 RepID=A0A1B6C991_9HEMI